MEADTLIETNHGDLDAANADRISPESRVIRGKLWITCNGNIWETPELMHPHFVTDAHAKANGPNRRTKLYKSF